MSRVTRIGALAAAASLVVIGTRPVRAQQPDSAAANAAASLPRDTTITLAIADRQWQRDDVTVGIHLRYDGAPTAGPTWHASIGASARLAQATASLHGVYGTIHLRTDPAAFGAIRAPRGTTPTPVPPRR